MKDNLKITFSFLHLDYILHKIFNRKINYIFYFL